MVGRKRKKPCPGSSPYFQPEPCPRVTRSTKRTSPLPSEGKCHSDTAALSTDIPGTDVRSADVHTIAVDSTEDDQRSVAEPAKKRKYRKPPIKKGSAASSLAKGSDAAAKAKTTTGTAPVAAKAGVATGTVAPPAERSECTAASDWAKSKPPSDGDDDEDDDDDDDVDWEEVPGTQADDGEVDTLLSGSLPMPPAMTSDCVTVDIAVSKGKKRKTPSAKDYLNRLLNKVMRETQVMKHKVHLLGLIANALHINAVCNEDFVQAMALSRLSADFLTGNSLSRQQLIKVLSWFAGSLPVVQNEDTAGKEAAARLGQLSSVVLGLQSSVFHSHLDRTLALLACLRVIGLSTRLIRSLQPVALKWTGSKAPANAESDAAKALLTSPTCIRSPGSQGRSIEVIDITDDVTAGDGHASAPSGTASSTTRAATASPVTSVYFEARTSTPAPGSCTRPSPAPITSLSVTSPASTNDITSSASPATSTSVKADCLLTNTADTKTVNQSCADSSSMASTADSSSMASTLVATRVHSCAPQQDNVLSDKPTARRRRQRQSRRRAGHDDSQTVPVSEVLSGSHSESTLPDTGELSKGRKSPARRSSRCRGKAASNTASSTAELPRTRPSPIHARQAKELSAEEEAQRDGKSQQPGRRSLRSQARKADQTTVMECSDSSGDSDSDSDFRPSQSLHDFRQQQSQKTSPAVKDSPGNDSLPGARSSSPSDSDSDFQLPKKKIKRMSSSSRVSPMSVDRYPQKSQAHLADTQAKSKSSTPKLEGVEASSAASTARRRRHRSSSSNSTTARAARTIAGIDCWLEVYVEEEKSWIFVEPNSLQAISAYEIADCASQPISYVVAIDSKGRVKDLTQRYARDWMTRAKRRRVDAKWWQEVMTAYAPLEQNEDMEEDLCLQAELESQPLPTSIQDYKGHPLYVLQRHLLKFEALHPPDLAPVGFVGKTAVYPRSAVHTLHTRETWLKDARSVKEGEQAYKMVKARPKRSTPAHERGKQLAETFGLWQTEDYVPPTAVDGKVPRNAYGNVELFKPSMLPFGCRHIQDIPNLGRIARKLGIDCAEAMVGWDQHSGYSHPIFDGVIVCEEFADTLLDAWEQDRAESERKAHEKREKLVLGRWAKFTKGLLIQSRVKTMFGASHSNSQHEEMANDEAECHHRQCINDDDDDDDDDAMNGAAGNGSDGVAATAMAGEVHEAAWSALARGNTDDLPGCRLIS